MMTMSSAAAVQVLWARVGEKNKRPYAALGVFLQGYPRVASPGSEAAKALPRQHLAKGYLEQRLSSRRACPRSRLERAQCVPPGACAAGEDPSRSKSGRCVCSQNDRELPDR